MSASPSKVAAVVGSPIAHSLSPVLHNAAYASLGLDWHYVAFEVGEADFQTAVRGAAALGMRGLSVTSPCKERAASLADRRSVAARKLGAANTMSFEGATVLADSTDGAGFLADLTEGAHFDPDGASCAVIGAGGAARAVVLALAEAGAREVLVINRTPIGAFRAAALARQVGRVARPEEIDNADLVVQATPVGMGEAGGDALSAGGWPAGADPDRLGAGQLAIDIVYHPRTTRWLEAAGQAGAATRNGLGMLVRQAALQVTLWTGAEAPLQQMWEAVSGL